jgi:xylulokinase
MRYGAQKLRELSSSPLMSQSLGPKIMWLRDNEPEVFARTKRYLTANGYIVYKLTGTFVVDHHQASYFTPFINARRGCWDLRFADGIVDESQLPDIVWSSEVVGEITKAASDACGLPTGTPVTAGSADGLLEGLSAGVIEPGTALINYASTMNIVLVTDHLAVTDQFWSSRGIFPGTFVISGGVATAGSITSWFRRELARELTQETVGDVAAAHGTLIAEAEQSPVGSNGLLMLPYFSGEDTPFYDPNARGIITGLNLATTRGDLYRATLEGTALGIYDNLIQMRSAGFEINKLRALGGGVKSRLWPQIVSDMTGLAQELPARTTGAPYGSAFLAGLAAGLLSIEDLEERWVKISRQIEPYSDHGGYYERLYKQYKRLYRDTNEIVHELTVSTE